VPMKVYHIRLPENVIARLREIPKASELARFAIETELELHSSEILNAQIAQIDNEATNLKRRLLSLEERRTSLDALQRIAAVRHSKSQDARIKLLEFANDNPSVKWDRWLDSRADIIADCGFEGVKDAVDWLQTQKVRR